MQVSTYRTQSEELAERLSVSQDRLLQLQGEVESKDKTVRGLMQKLSEHDSEQRNAKQEAQLQTEELTEQIKMLQEQLLEVSIFCRKRGLVSIETALLRRWGLEMNVWFYQQG